MKGKLRWNAAWAIFGFLITFLLSLRNNILTTSLMRGFLSGLIFFLLVYAVRFLIRLVITGGTEGRDTPLSDAVPNGLGEDTPLGRSLDFTTPDEGEELNQLLKPQAGNADSFAPLNPPKLSTRITDDPTRMAQALRQMTEE